MGNPNALVTPLSIETLGFEDWWHKYGRKILKMKQIKQKRKTANNNAVSLRNTLNELTGAEWLYFTKSILITAYPSEYGHEMRQHLLAYIPNIAHQYIVVLQKPKI